MRRWLMGFSAGVAITLLHAQPSLAATIVLAQAVVDWSGFAYTISGDLVIARIDGLSYRSTSNAATAAGRSFNFGSLDAAAASSSTTSGGSASTEASASNGLARSESTATALGNEPSTDQEASSGANTGFSMWMYGSGVGALTVSVPYSLTIRVDTDLGPAFGQSVSAFAGVGLSGGTPGASGSVSTGERLFWHWSDPVTNGLLTRTGILALTARIDLNRFPSGPIVFSSAGGGTHARVRATVPDSSTPILMEASLIAMFFVAFRSLQGRNS